MVRTCTMIRMFCIQNHAEQWTQTAQPRAPPVAARRARPDRRILAAALTTGRTTAGGPAVVRPAYASEG
ncbi:hypothetical protein ACFRAU_02540 [Arthrobacter sp. NPDC056691]|uniref:hypothetical protein n=1 Tax=Arthrobacter sp. NPDC056691 TaxID=3345913 RepID=UPI00366F0F0F